MFKRREPRSVLQIVREVFWPSMGWRRSLRYVQYRIVRLSDSSHRIAAGLALGGAVSFTPILGTHFIQAGLAAYFMRVNLLAALIGTFFGNPWTFPFMWWGSIQYGSYLFGLFGFPTSTALPAHMDFGAFWSLVVHEPLRVFLPWMVGGYSLAFLVWPVFYVVALYLVKAAKAGRTEARRRRFHETALQVTEQAGESGA